MKALTSSLQLVPVMLLSLGVFTGCESTDGGGSSASTSVYYGVGFYDPWYYGDYHDHADIIVTPPRPGERPIAPPRPENPLPPPRPEHPIARPTPTPAPAPRPMPSIPSAPRASFRR